MSVRNHVLRDARIKEMKQIYGFKCGYYLLRISLSFRASRARESLSLMSLTIVICARVSAQQVYIWLAVKLENASEKR